MSGLHYLRLLTKQGTSVADLIQVYITLIRPVLEYGHVLLVGCTREQERLIERVQRRALRIVSMGGRREVPVLPTLKERRELAAVKLLKNMLEEDHPLHDLVPPARTRATGRTLRNATAITVPAARTQRLKNSFLHQAIRLYNKILGLKWWHKVAHGEIRRRAHVEPLETLLLQRQLRWAGHVIRMPGNRLPRHILYGELTNGCRSVGGQHKRYKDNLKANLKKCGLQPHRLEEAAAERSRWRQECATGITTYTAEYNRLREERSQRRHQPPSSTGEHACDVCGRTCLSRIGLVSHRRTHRSDVIVGNDGQP
ncbi:hypothetical protein Bbelb_080810 [Branchiostoma belcheri]|nr:hypothetical protein Bbelb_080810 [Branchiostoma belcheri]